MRVGEKEPALASTTIDDFVSDITGRVELFERSVGQSIGGLGAGAPLHRRAPKETICPRCIYNWGIGGV